MSNPLRKHANNMFASRGCDIDAAMAYATEVLLASGLNPAAAMTALMVVVNTAANAFDQARGPSPEKLAIIELIDSRINEHLLREGDMDQKISDWFDANVSLDDSISSWMSDNFDLNDYNVSDAITDWMGDNFADKVQDLDLVVRAR